MMTCQVGAEPALKREVARSLPEWRFSYARPGFVTFRLSGVVPPSLPALVFARAQSVSLGKVSGDTPESRAADFWRLVAGQPATALHVWPRDQRKPGEFDYVPGPTAAAAEVDALLRLSGANMLQAGESRALDCVLVGDSEWWAGWHRIEGVEQAWPGGFFPDALPEHAVSRGYLKMGEALLWSGLPIDRGDLVAEIGCSPGGASQALLDRGARVLGIDPAEVHPEVLADPRFRHIQRRSKDVRHREYLGVRFITIDINLPPKYTLDALEGVLAIPGVELGGVLMTLKFGAWELADLIPEYLERVRSWGFPTVKARQLHHNRQEICVAALA